MFIVQKNEAQADQLGKLLRKVKVVYGNLPPQMEFLGNIDTEYLEEFLHKIMP